MIQSHLTQEAEAGSQRYGLLVASWRGVYDRVRSQARLASAADINDALHEAQTVGSIFLRNEREHIDRIASQIVREAHQTTSDEIEIIATHELTDEAGELLSDTIEYLVGQLRLQIMRDLASLEVELRRAILELRVSSRSRGVSFRRALVERQISANGSIEFGQHDRASRKWASTKVVRLIWRHTLLSLYNETVLVLLADHGITQAQIVHVNPSSQFHGLRLALHPASDLPTYGELRDEVFHPNSDAILSARAA